MKRWYAVNTLPHQEARAAANLSLQGYHAWLPSIFRSRRHARRIDTIKSPLFPGYLFVELDVECEAWSSINGTFGVRRLLCSQDRPMAVPAPFISALRCTLNDQGTVVAADAGLKPGAKVRMIAGPFVNCVGTLLSLAAKDRVALLLNVLGQEVSTVVSRRILVPAS
jgi:transcriptional antiterminator RfaH